MKRSILESFLSEHGYFLLRNSKHAIYSNGFIQISLPHHKDINIHLAKKLMKTIVSNTTNNIYTEQRKAA